MENLAVALDVDLQPLRERVDHGDTNAVQAARNLVALAAELAAGVELREDDRHSRETLVGHHAGRDPGAVVADRDRVVRVKGDLDPVGTPRESLVDRVVDDLEDQVMEPARARRADVHARAQPDRLEAFEDGDVFSGIGSFSQIKKPCKRATLGV